MYGTSCLKAHSIEQGPTCIAAGCPLKSQCKSLKQFMTVPGGLELVAEKHTSARHVLRVQGTLLIRVCDPLVVSDCADCKGADDEFCKAVHLGCTEC